MSLKIKWHSLYNNSNYYHYYCNLELFWGERSFGKSIVSANSETVVYMKEIWCISTCVLGFSFDTYSLGIVVVSLWGEKIDLPKVGCDVPTWLFLVFKDLWETSCTFSGLGRNSSNSKCLVTALWCSTLGIEWIICGVSPVWPSSIWTPGHILIWLTLSLNDDLVVSALCNWMIYTKALSFICCLTTEFSIK